MIKNKAIRIFAVLLLAAVLCFALCVSACAEYIYGYFRYTVSDGSVTITAYTGDESVVTVPAMIAGNPVNTIASGAFASCPEVTTVYLPETVTVVQGGAFAGQGVIYLSSQPAASTATESPAPADEPGSSSSEAQDPAGGTDTVTTAPVNESGTSLASGGGNSQPASGNTASGGTTGTGSSSGNSSTTVTVVSQSSGFTEVDIVDTPAGAPAATTAKESVVTPAAETAASAAEAAVKPEAEAAENQPATEVTAVEPQQPAVLAPAKAEKRSILPVVVGSAVLIVLICIMLILRRRQKKQH